MQDAGEGAGAFRGDVAVCEAQARQEVRQGYPRRSLSGDRGEPVTALPRHAALFYSGRCLREQQCFVEGIDDASKRGAAFLAFEAVALESARVDVGRAISVKHEPCITRRADDELRRRQLGCFVHIRDWAVMAHRRFFSR